MRTEAPKHDGKAMRSQALHYRILKIEKATDASPPSWLQAFQRFLLMDLHDLGVGQTSDGCIQAVLSGMTGKSLGDKATKPGEAHQDMWLPHIWL